MTLVVVALGLPINDLFRYALLVIAAVMIFGGAISPKPKSWLAAALIAVLTGFAHSLVPAPRIEIGENVFLVGGAQNALVAGLPSDAYRLMAMEFDRAYPPERRCNAADSGCWLNQGRPDRPYAFSSDGIFDRPMYSRRVAGLDFSDPVWLRLGFINESKYNWTGHDTDLQRNVRERSILKLLHPWRLAMPYFVMVSVPQNYAGRELCWRGLALWEGADEKFAPLRHDAMACRTLDVGDVGRRIFGVAIGAPLAMTLDPPAMVRIRQIAADALTATGIVAVLLLLVSWRRRVLPFLLILMSLLIVLLNDASFIGGLRPFDGGDDGLAYDGFARGILQHALRGEWAQAIRGGESVFFYGGPGLRYLRALEHIVFGEAYLGYLSLILTLPFVVLALFQRFLSPRAALALTFVFIAIPIGAVFGTSFFHYAKWAARGFADPAAATLFIAALVTLVGRTPDGPGARFAPAFGAGLLFALALFVRPNLAPGAAALLGGAGLAALWQSQWLSLSGLCIGFLPVFGMALHNWVFGGVFVLFSANATIPEALPMPPSAYVAAFGELLRFDLMGEHVRRGMLQIARWLAGPSESFVMIPLHALAIAVLVRVGIARQFDPWLRQIAWSALALHPVALFYLSADRYYYLMWFLTYLVCAVWTRDEGFDRLRRWCPSIAQWLERHPARAPLTRMLDRWADRA